MDKLLFSERDICTKFITPAIQQAGWQQHEFREEVQLTDGRVMVRGKLATRIKNPDAKGGPKRADYVLYGRPNIPIAVVEEEEELKVPPAQVIAKLRLVSSLAIKELAPLAAILARQQNEMAVADLWQRLVDEIDAFYAQLKLEVGKGWIAEPAVAKMREVEAG